MVIFWSFGKSSRSGDENRVQNYSHPPTCLQKVTFVLRAPISAHPTNIVINAPNSSTTIPDAQVRLAGGLKSLQSHCD